MSAGISIQYVTDEDGQKTAAIIPIKQWQEFARIIDQYLELENSIKQGMEEVKEMKAGNRPIPSVQDFLNEL